MIMILMMMMMMMFLQMLGCIFYNMQSIAFKHDGTHHIMAAVKYPRGCFISILMYLSRYRRFHIQLLTHITFIIVIYALIDISAKTMLPFCL